MDEADLFWMVATTDQKRTPGKLEADSGIAIDEAKALAEDNPGMKVYLLKTVTVFEAEIKVNSTYVDRAVR